jgi:hypothetical protein
MKTVIYYNRYVDDTLIIFNSTLSSEDQITNIIPTSFTPTHENNNCINFLYLLVIKNENKLNIDIYKKLITTDVTIHYNSNHQTEHKLAPYRYLINPRYHLLLTTDKKQKKRR